MSNKEKEALMPKLRFPEFRGTAGWGRHDLGNICEILNNRRRPITGSDREPGPYPYYGASGVVDFVKEFIFDERLLLVGEDGAKWNAFEKTAFIVEGKYWVNNHAHVLKPTEINDSLLENYLTMTDLGGFVTGAAPPKLTLGKLKSIPIPIPPSDIEQQKIADCLSSLDELIAAQARKVDALKTHKKGLMQQLFPREGETQPRLRFPEFRGGANWREEKLINLSSEPLSNGVFNDPKKVGSGYKVINVSDMYIETTIEERRLTLLELSPSDFAANQVIKGDIFFTRSSLVKSGIAVSNIYLGSSNDVTYDGHLIRFRPCASKVVPLFAHYLFKTEPIRAQLIARGKTATMTTIGQADVASVTLFYPDKAEQQRIADCLTALDTHITTAAQELETLKTHKKGLMQQLFPSAQEMAA